MALEKIASKLTSVRLRQRISIEEARELFPSQEAYEEFRVQLRRDQRHVFVHIEAAGDTGKVEVLGISATKEGYGKGQYERDVGAGAVPFLSDRLNEIRGLLPHCEPEVMYAHNPDSVTSHR